MDELRRKAAQVRNLPEYKEWRKKVLGRDEFRCIECGTEDRASRLEADHIKPFLLYPELIFELSNGRTLCKPCHAKTSTYGNSLEHRRAHMENVHPFLQGDYLLKLKSLPSSMADSRGVIAGFNLKYKIQTKTWHAGYGNSASIPGWRTEGRTPDEAIDSLITGLRAAAHKQDGRYWTWSREKKGRLSTSSSS